MVEGGRGTHWQSHLHRHWRYWECSRAEWYFSQDSVNLDFTFRVVTNGCRHVRDISRSSYTGKLGRKIEPDRNEETHRSKVRVSVWVYFTLGRGKYQGANLRVKWFKYRDLCTYLNVLYRSCFFVCVLPLVRSEKTAGQNCYRRTDQINRRSKMPIFLSKLLRYIRTTSQARPELDRHNRLVMITLKFWIVIVQFCPIQDWKSPRKRISYIVVKLAQT